MFRNYIIILIRNLLKYKGFSFINISGLAIGIACCIAILLFVKDEISYDKFNEKADRIYRVGVDAYFNKVESRVAASCGPLAKAAIRDVPEVENAVRILQIKNPVLRYKEKTFSEDRFFGVDSSLPDIFTFQFIHGDPKTALVKPFSMVLTESMAKKYFGEENPIGKVLNYNAQDDFTITGVLKDCPQNSHWRYEILSSLSSFPISQTQSWMLTSFYTYILLRHNVSSYNLDEKITATFQKYFEPELIRYAGASLDQIKKAGSRYKYLLQPLTDIHLKSKLEFEIEPNSDMQYVYIFSIVAFGVLVIACFNFINLSTVQALRRSKEIMIRKTVGSSFIQLIRQFLTESILMVTISVFLALLFVNLLMPILNDISKKSIQLNLLENIKLIPIMILFILLIGLAAGSYPAFFLASFKHSLVLSGKLKHGLKGKIFKSGLVIFQFAISIILIIGTFVIYNQVKYIQNKNLGYNNKEQLVILHKVDHIGRFINAFKEELRKNKNIINSTSSSALPSWVPNTFGLYGYMTNKTGAEGLRVFKNMHADYDFYDTYGLEISKGRYYSREEMIDTVSSIVINETAAKILDFNEPLGRDLYQTAQGKPIELKVIGIVKDFHFESLHSKIVPLVIHLTGPQRYGKYLTLRVQPEDIQNTIAYIQKIWTKFAGDQAMELTFHSKDFEKVYHSEYRTGKLFAIFSLFGILISCLGLLGLAAQMLEKRTKEIGIRKALGASVHSILFLLSKSFSGWLLISNIIAWPIAYFLMNSWLNSFAYRINIMFWTFLISGIIALIVAFATIIYQTLRAARTNPINSLKYE